MVTSSDVHSSRLSFWATTLATEKLSQPHGQVDSKQQQNNYYQPVKVFVETTLMILPDGASQNLRKFLCKKKKKKNYCFRDKSINVRLVSQS